MGGEVGAGGVTMARGDFCALHFGYFGVWVWERGDGPGRERGRGKGREREGRGGVLITVW